MLASVAGWPAAPRATGAAPRRISRRPKPWWRPWRVSNRIRTSHAASSAFAPSALAGELRIGREHQPALPPRLREIGDRVARRDGRAVDRELLQDLCGLLQRRGGSGAHQALLADADRVRVVPQHLDLHEVDRAGDDAVLVEDVEPLALDRI